MGSWLSLNSGKRPGNVLPCLARYSRVRRPVKGRMLINSVNGRPFDAPCAGATPDAPLEVFSAGTRGELPHPAPRLAARAGVQLSFARRSGVLRRERCEPALPRVALNRQLPCRHLWRPRRVFRHRSTTSCSATMASRQGCLFTEWSGMPPWLPPLPRSPRQFRLRSRTPVVSSCPVTVPKVSRGCRPAASGCHLQPILSRPDPSVSIRLRRLNCGNVANPCLPVHHPGLFQNALP